MGVVMVAATEAMGAMEAVMEAMGVMEVVMGECMAVVTGDMEAMEWAWEWVGLECQVNSPKVFYLTQW